MILSWYWTRGSFGGPYGHRRFFRRWPAAMEPPRAWSWWCSWGDPGESDGDSPTDMRSPPSTCWVPERSTLRCDDYAKDRCHAAQVLPPSKDPKIFAQTDGISHRCGWPFAQIVALLPDLVPCRVAGVVDPRTGCSPAPPNRNILWDARGYGQYVFLIGAMAYRVKMSSPSVQKPSAQGAWRAPPKDCESPPLVRGKLSGFFVFLYIRKIFEKLHMVWDWNALSAEN